MFNPLEAHELIEAVGRLLRAAADGDGAAADDYQRSQLKSGYSVARHLAAEQAAAVELLAGLRADLLGALGGRDGAAAERIASARSGAELGELVADLLEGLEDDALRTRLHGVLRAMADREVAALATASG